MNNSGRPPPCHRLEGQEKGAVISEPRDHPVEALNTVGHTGSVWEKRKLLQETPLKVGVRG